MTNTSLDFKMNSMTLNRMLERSNPWSVFNSHMNQSLLTRITLSMRSSQKRNRKPRKPNQLEKVKAMLTLEMESHQRRSLIQKITFGPFQTTRLSICHNASSTPRARPELTSESNRQVSSVPVSMRLSTFPWTSSFSKRSKCIMRSKNSFTDKLFSMNDTLLPRVNAWVNFWIQTDYISKTIKFLKHSLQIPYKNIDTITNHVNS